MTIVHSHHAYFEQLAVKGREVFTPLGLWNVSLVDYVCSLHSMVRNICKMEATEVFHFCRK